MGGSCAAQSGDTLVIEVGFQWYADANGYLLRASYGSPNASDLTDGGDGSTHPSWVDLTYTAGGVASGSQLAASGTWQSAVVQSVSVGGGWQPVSGVWQSVGGQWLTVH